MPTQSLLTPEVVDLVGGLDFVTPRPSVTPGSLIECYNFEVADRLGYQRIQGIEKFDGGACPSLAYDSLYTWLVRYGGTYTFPVAGDIVYGLFLNDPNYYYFGVVTSVQTQADLPGLGVDDAVIDLVVLDFNMYNRYITYSDTAHVGSSLGGILNAGDWAYARSSDGFVPNQPTSMSISDLRDGLVTEYTNLQYNITNASSIYGNTQGFYNPPIALNWYKDSLYAVVDLYSFAIIQGSTMPLPGDLISSGGFSGIVRDFIDSGGWDSGTGAGTVFFSPSADKNVNLGLYQAGIGLSDLADIDITRGASTISEAFKFSVDSGHDYPSTGRFARLVKATNIPLQNDRPPAVFTDRGFSEIEQGYVFSFGDGTTNGPPNTISRDAQPVAANIFSETKGFTATTTAAGWHKTSGTVGQWIYQGGTADTPISCITGINDGNYVHPANVLSPAIFSGMGFSTIPSDTIITGISVDVHHWIPSGAVGKSTKFNFSLTLDDVNFSNTKSTRDTSTYSASTSGTATDLDTLGSITDLWGLSTLTPANINSLKLYVSADSPVGKTGNIDSMFITIYAQTSATRYYFYNGIDDVTAIITNAYVDPSNGTSWDDGNAAGAMQVVDVEPAHLTPPVISGVTNTSTGGSLPATTDYYYVVTALGTTGETIASNELTITTSGTTTNKNTVSWTAVTGATGYKIYYGTASGVESSYQILGAVTSFDHTVTTGWTFGSPPSTNSATNAVRQTILSGDKIYTGALGTGSLIATVTSTMAFAGIPSLSATQATNSRYEIINANFYGNTDWESMYGCSGAGRAWVWDGYYFRYIYTGLNDSLDIPRHLAFNSFHLCLGYGTGAVLSSVVGNPEDFDGVNGAAEFDTGDSITGLLRLTGTALGIFCRNSIQALNGTDNSNFSMSVLNPYEGAIEYTIVDCGKPIWASYRGISTLDQSNAYGNFLGSRLSSAITPWLLPRLTNTHIYSTSGGNITYGPNSSPLFAVPVRGKNQYKLAFADGYWLTMTLQGANFTPTFTIQKIALSGSVDTNPETLVPLGCSAGIDSTGKDRIHLSWYDPSKGRLTVADAATGADSRNYVWELDKGWGFGAFTPVEAWFTTSHNFFDNPFQIASVRNIRLHGLSHGFGSLDVASSADYLSNDFRYGNDFFPGPVSTNTSPQDISLPREGDDNPYYYFTGNYYPQTNIAAVGKTGRSFSFQFSSTPTSIEPPLVAQHLMFQISSGKADIK